MIDQYLKMMNINDPDLFYENLIFLHEGKTFAESSTLNAKIILVMANVIGDIDLLNRILEIAREEK